MGRRSTAPRWRDCRRRPPHPPRRRALLLVVGIGSLHIKLSSFDQSPTAYSASGMTSKQLCRRYPSRRRRGNLRRVRLPRRDPAPKTASVDRTVAIQCRDFPSGIGRRRSSKRSAASRAEAPPARLPWSSPPPARKRNRPSGPGQQTARLAGESDTLSAGRSRNTAKSWVSRATTTERSFGQFRSGATRGTFAPARFSSSKIGCASKGARSILASAVSNSKRRTRNPSAARGSAHQCRAGPDQRSPSSARSGVRGRGPARTIRPGPARDAPIARRSPPTDRGLVRRQRTGRLELRASPRAAPSHRKNNARRMSRQSQPFQILRGTDGREIRQGGRVRCDLTSGMPREVRAR